MRRRLTGVLRCDIMLSVAMLVAIQVASIHPNKQAAAQAVDMQIVLEFHM